MVRVDYQRGIAPERRPDLDRNRHGEDLRDVDVETELVCGQCAGKRLVLWQGEGQSAVGRRCVAGVEEAISANFINSLAPQGECI